MPSGQNQIRIVVYKDEGIWVAQCLEHDVSVQADDLGTLKSRLDAALIAEAEQLESIGAAPKFFFDLWEKRSTFKSTGPENSVMAIAA